jgi:energy-coupling factor transport system permease protein
LLGVLMLSALEGSWHVAEAMEARGFGLGRRTAYTREKWSWRDGWLLGAFWGAVAVMAWLSLGERMAYQYYPRLQPLKAAEELAVGLALLGAALLMPLAVLKRRRG